MNQSSSISLSQSIEMPSVSALDNGVSFDFNLRMRHDENLRAAQAVKSAPHKTPKKPFQETQKPEPATSISKRNLNHHNQNNRKSSQVKFNNYTSQVVDPTTLPLSIPSSKVVLQNHSSAVEQLNFSPGKYQNDYFTNLNPDRNGSSTTDQVIDRVVQGLVKQSIKTSTLPRLEKSLSPPKRYRGKEEKDVEDETMRSICQVYTTEEEEEVVSATKDENVRRMLHFCQPDSLLPLQSFTAEDRTNKERTPQKRAKDEQQIPELSLFNQQSGLKQQGITDSQHVQNQVHHIMFSSYKNSPSHYQSRENTRYSNPPLNFQDTIGSSINTESPPRQNLVVPQANQLSQAQLQLQQQIKQQLSGFIPNQSASKGNVKRSSPLSNLRKRGSPVSNSQAKNRSIAVTTIGGGTPQLPQKQSVRINDENENSQPRLITPDNKFIFSPQSVYGDQPSARNEKEVTGFLQNSCRLMSSISKGNCYQDEQSTKELNLTPTDGSKSLSRERRSRQNRLKRNQDQNAPTNNKREEGMLQNYKKSVASPSPKSRASQRNSPFKENSIREVLGNSINTLSESNISNNNNNSNHQINQSVSFQSPTKKTVSFQSMHSHRSSKSPSKENQIAFDFTPFQIVELSSGKLTGQAQRIIAQENFRRNLAAKRIQRIFRTYLLWKRFKMRNERSVERRRQEKLQKILAAKIIVRWVKQWLQTKRAKAVRKQIVMNIIKIQRWIRRGFMVKRLSKRQRSKKVLLALFQGWKTRRIVNSLAKEIQDYVNCDEVTNPYLKTRLKNHFLVLFENVIKNELWLSKNRFRLQRLQSLQQNVLQLKTQNNLQVKELPQQKSKNANAQLKSLNDDNKVRSQVTQPRRTPQRQEKNQSTMDVSQSDLQKKNQHTSLHKKTASCMGAVRESVFPDQQLKGKQRLANFISSSHQHKGGLSGKHHQRNVSAISVLQPSKQQNQSALTIKHTPRETSRNSRSISVEKTGSNPKERPASLTPQTQSRLSIPPNQKQTPNQYQNFEQRHSMFGTSLHSQKDLVNLKPKTQQQSQSRIGQGLNKAQNSLQSQSNQFKQQQNQLNATQTSTLSKPTISSMNRDKSPKLNGQVIKSSSLLQRGSAIEDKNKQVQNQALTKAGQRGVTPNSQTQQKGMNRTKTPQRVEEKTSAVSTKSITQKSHLGATIESISSTLSHNQKGVSQNQRQSIKPYQANQNYLKHLSSTSSHDLSFTKNTHQNSSCVIQKNICTDKRQSVGPHHQHSKSALNASVIQNLNQSVLIQNSEPTHKNSLISKPSSHQSHQRSTSTVPVHQQFYGCQNKQLTSSEFNVKPVSCFSSGLVSQNGTQPFTQLNSYKQSNCSSIEQSISDFRQSITPMASSLLSQIGDINGVEKHQAVSISGGFNLKLNACQIKTAQSFETFDGEGSFRGLCEKRDQSVTAEQEYIQYKKYLQEIESILDHVYLNQNQIDQSTPVAVTQSDSSFKNSFSKQSSSRFSLGGQSNTSQNSTPMSQHQRSSISIPDKLKIREKLNNLVNELKDQCGLHNSAN